MTQRHSFWSQVVWIDLVICLGAAVLLTVLRTSPRAVGDESAGQPPASAEEQRVSARAMLDGPKVMAVERPARQFVETLSSNLPQSATRGDNPVVTPGLVQWHPSFDAACQASRVSGKPVLLFHLMGRLDQKFCGTVVTRTRHGNIATYFCTPDGIVIDVLPGVYDPAGYRDRLNEIRLVAQTVQELDGSERGGWLANYHKERLESLASGRSIPASSKFDRSKGRVQGGLKRDLLVRSGAESNVAGARPVPQPITPEGLATWSLLLEDTQLNETIRRRQVHSQLASQPLARPDALVKWLYKEVMHLDLDDPYLGLQKTLFDGYPFDDRTVR